MGQINIYKIDTHKYNDFETELTRKYVSSDPITRVVAVGDIKRLLTLTLHTATTDEENYVEWKWLLSCFDEETLTTRTNPKSILVVDDGDAKYAFSFGFSFFTVDKYCDTDFAFEFARKTRLKEIKTTTLTSPASKRNKVVNTYVDYISLDIDSGEAFSKIKAKIELEEDFDLFEEFIEVGHSIKLTIKNDNIDTVINTLLFIENRIQNGCDIYKIPVFNKVSNKELIKTMTDNLVENISTNPLAMNFSELDIIGASEVFNNNDATFTLKYGRHEVELDLLSFEGYNDFTLAYNLSFSDAFNKIKVISKRNGIAVKTDKIINLIDYIDEANRCVLSKGKWYYFNDDYLSYLSESLLEITTIYEPEFDFSGDIHNDFIDDKYYELQNDIEYQALNETEAKKKLKRKFYAERCFNLLRERDDGFINYDRIEQRLGTASVELMDLYKEQAMYAVKIGKASSTLCYVVDQSLSSLKMYKQHLLQSMPEITTVVIWIILERANHLSTLADGTPNLNSLDMLILKNKIDLWKKEVRLCGLKPVVRINYRT